ncbi:MAG: DUF975 family protein [Candidatus Cloacimonetes bacterium]|nr:DUF975 family protein [Candidatus Cloacimonadota bacterium]
MRTAFYKVRARRNLEGKWESAIVTVLLGFLVFAAIDAIFGKTYLDGGFFILCLRLVFQGPVTLGMMMFFLSNSRNSNPQVSLLFKGFDNWINAFLTILLSVMIIAFWSIFLLVPGIIAALSYSMSFYILADNPESKPLEALRRSKLMMKGHKTELFKLQLSFIGWLFLSLITCGILFIFYVGPLYFATITEFYESLQEISDY